MKVDLDKEGLISLVKGVSPYYNLFEHPLVKNSGNFNGSQSTWTWGNLSHLTEEELYGLYKICRDSWK